MMHPRIPSSIASTIEAKRNRTYRVLEGSHKLRCLQEHTR